MDERQLWNSWKVDVNSRNVWVCSDVDYCCRPISTHILINFSNWYREKGNICLNNIAKRKNRRSSHENFTSLHLNADAKFTHMVYIKNIRHFPQSYQNKTQSDLSWLRSNRSNTGFLEAEKLYSSQIFSFFPSLFSRK